jgi:hypothetical protein
MKQFYFLFLLFLPYVLYSQDFNSEAWIGKYAGTMKLSSINGWNDEVHVEFEFREIKKDSVWTYTMCYKSEQLGELIKDYRIIRPTGNVKSAFKLDEQDGIIIDMTYMNNCFFSMFEVEGMIHTSSMQLVDTTIRFEMFGGDLTTPSNVTTSLPEGDSNETYKVSSYKPSYAQTVSLKRIN